MIELIVSLGVFSIAVLLATSSYLALTNAQKKATALQSVQDNLRFTIEAIAREIRLGTSSRGAFYFGYYCTNSNINGQQLTDSSGIPSWTPTNCPIASGGGTVLVFRGPEGKVVVYRFGTCSSSQLSCIEKATAPSATQPNFTVTDTDFIPLTAPEIVVNTFKFYLSGADRGDNLPTRVSMVIDGKAMVGTQSSSFHLATTVAQREYRRAFQ